MQSIWLFFILVLVSVQCQPRQLSTSIKTKPNVVFILTDDQGWGDLSINGNQNLSTPNIDQLAIKGATFEHFYVSPVCSPTRAEILTGRYHVRGGVYSTSAGGERLDLDEKTVAKYFQEAGYQTAAFGKWHNGMQYPYHPNARGFDEFYGFCSGHWGHYFSPMLEHNGQLVKGNGFVANDFTDHAMHFIEQNQDTSFFIYLAYNTPHSPMQVPDQWWDKFATKEIPFRHRDPEKEDLLHSRAALAMCENIDWNVGRIQQKLSELDILENTIIVYLSDNGPNGWRWNGEMKGRKGSTDEGGTRSPLFLQWSGKINPGIQIPQIASAIDLLPTLMDLAGIQRRFVKEIDGLSLKPLLMTTTAEWPKRLVFNHWRGNTSVRSQDYRLDQEGNLFDMVNDPGQRKDISKDLPDITNSMDVEKKKWEIEVLSELPTIDQRPFPVGHVDFLYTQIPARDGKAHGNVKRSNRHPNCTFFTNFKSNEDSISWDIEVLTHDEYQVIVYYTCSAENVGSLFEIKSGTSTLQGTIRQAHDPPLVGMSDDRHPRIESYVKEFRPLNIGVIKLEKGAQKLVLKPISIPGSEMMDFRLMMLNRKAE